MENVKRRYQAALDEFVLQAKEDRYIIAAIVAGSYTQGLLWEKSDIDLILLVDDAKRAYHFNCLVEDDILINTTIYTRHHFKRAFEASPGSNNLRSFLSKAEFLFTKDPTLETYFKEMNVLEEYEKNGLLLYQGTLAVAHYVKSQKYLYAQKDVLYSFIEMMKLTESLAKIELLLHDQLPQKDVMNDALELNNEIFSILYTRLNNEAKTTGLLEETLDCAYKYIKLHEQVLFAPILEILAELSRIVAFSELHEEILGICNIEKDLFVEATEWLTSEKIIYKYAVPLRITTKSRTMMNEAAYSYEGGE